MLPGRRDHALGQQPFEHVGDLTDLLAGDTLSLQGRQGHHHVGAEVPEPLQVGREQNAALNMRVAGAALFAQGVEHGLPDVLDAKARMVFIDGRTPQQALHAADELTGQLVHMFFCFSESSSVNSTT